MLSGIYKITHIQSGRFYIGSAKNFKSRWNTHKQDLAKNKHHSKYLQAIYNKYGKDSISYEIIEYCEIEKLLIREQFYLDTMKPQLNSLKIAGSPLGYRHTEETKKKLAERQRGRKVKFSEEALANIREGIKNRIYSDEAKARMVKAAKERGWPKLSKETIDKIAAFHTGRKRSQETKNRISEGRKGKQISPQGLAKMKAKMQSPEMRQHLSNLAKNRPSPNKGKPLSEERKQHLSKIKKGKPLSEEHKAKIRAACAKGFNHTDEAKRKMAASKLRFTKEEVLEIREKYKSGLSMEKLAQQYNVMRHTIGRVINGKGLYSEF